MSPASKSKSKDKKAGKEPPKGSLKPSGHVNASNGIPASGYNPLLGTFHTFEMAPAPSASPPNVNGRFRNIDDVDDHNGNSYGAGVDYDSVSNNGSWSGESEDHKEKPSQPSRQETVPGADNDKREKIRQKNERKHQRQKERRAQELHERCTGYLMSRKLEALAQQLVAMGFPQERATMALILNEGRVEESVAWLFEGGEEDKRIEHNTLNSGGNLKIDISEELARIAEMEIRYMALKQEVERAIVACEGDLEKAEESLKVQKRESPAAPPKPEEGSDPPVGASGKLPKANSQNIMRAQVEMKHNSPATIHQKRDDKDFNYAKVPLPVEPSADSGTKGMQPPKKILPKVEKAKAQQMAVPVEKSWPSAGSNRSVSYSLTSPLQASLPPSMMDARYLAVGNELKNLQLGSMREPVVVDRTQTTSAKQAPNSSVGLSPPGTSVGRYPGSMDTMKPNGFVPPIAVSRSLSSNGVNSNPHYSQARYHSQQQFVSNGNSIDSQGMTRGGLWNRGAAPTLSAASSLGLFSRMGANGSSTGPLSRVDWNAGCSMLQFDYTNVDWSLDLGSLPTKPNSLWSGSNYSLQNNATHAYDSFAYGVGVKSSLRPIRSNGNMSSVQEFQEGVPSTESSMGGREWTSPFEEKDLFSLPRQFVSSPSL